MPDCQYHTDHENRIKRNEEDIREHIQDSTTIRKELFVAIGKVKDEWSKRLPAWITFFVGGLMSLCTGLIVYLVKLKS